MASKKTLYQCFECGEQLDYNQLKMRLTYTENRKIEHYDHQCPICKGRKFIILSIVERLSVSDSERGATDQLEA